MLLVGMFGAKLWARRLRWHRKSRAGPRFWPCWSKPVGRGHFLLAKYAGVAAALSVLTYVNLVVALLTSRMAFDAYGSTDLFALGLFALAVVLAYLLGGFSNYFLRRPFVSDRGACDGW